MSLRRTVLGFGFLLALLLALPLLAFPRAQEEVKVGTTVTWINEGDAPHTSTAYVDGTKYWDSNILETGQSYAFTLTEPGFFDYLCTLHPNMTASLSVVE